MIFRENQLVAKECLLTTFQKYALLAVSFLIVAFGQPVWSVWLGLLAAICGFALFWRVLLAIPSRKERFYVAMGWYAAVQMVQLGWFASHPYAYIYGVLFFCAWLMGTQFGLLALAIHPSTFRRLSYLLALAGGWTVLEWSRLFILSGLSFNPVGLALSGAVYPLQLASVGGIYLLSFWVILTNLCILRAWLFHCRFAQVATALGLAFFPYLAGAIHFHYHAGQMGQDPRSVAVVLVQPASPIEENMGFQSAEEARDFVLHEWINILATTQKQLGRKVDLMVLPEYVVPYGTFHPVFPVDSIKGVWRQLFGPQALEALAPLEEPYAALLQTDNGKKWLVSNAFIVQSLANLFQAYVVVGLEDSVYVDEEQSRHESYSAAFHFSPNNLPAERYEKRVLVPMGEYIPFEFCRQLAARYGIAGSFTCGKEAKIFEGPVPYGATICYEETYGDLMRDNRRKGAELLVNLTNDGWYPHSRLPKQHFDHARLRTVESGIPLARACNTGITGGIDSLGQIVGVLGPDHMQTQELADSLYLDIPAYHYQTLYVQWGDRFILSLCSVFILAAVIIRKRNR
ncbi:Apolipoprotein N-acyltransferase [Candidatus Protochlamydia naegleriophila]|uniref:Apolipoprotein N-acyltransferase n=1 Tax=Candidatus Protochlamydia naegleriophila TaxID=389348 RepID=A0A0U5JCH3_9BACT|nr:apolipoprotein N-acyltransferase [Candidatus Protochlamydia naegleriophila]CUI17576.1 Apolipoprotein N-acyltransferase [Candidatus Protochlamydia naegleriophila]